MTEAERRLHVRMKPTPELPARAVLVTDGLVQESLPVFDVSVGGLALAVPAPGLVDTAVGSRLRLRLTLGDAPEHVVTIEVRWASPVVMGCLVVEATPEATQTLRRYVGELLERGGSS